MKRPDFMTEEGEQMLRAKYLLPGEDIEGLYRRLAKAAASYYPPHFGLIEGQFFDMLWNGWLCPSSPVLANFGTDRGLPIACYGSTPNEDSLDAIFDQATEIARLSKAGGGTAVNLSKLRGRGSIITNNGTSDGITSWCKLFDTVISVVNQGSTRRGSVALYLDIDHTDIEEFLRIRRPEGDVNRQCLNVHHGVVINDKFMNKLLDGDSHARKIWAEILKTRLETGEPYILFEDNANDTHNGGPREVTMSNLCSEIMLPSDENYTFVCCLSSMNLAKYEEWKGTNAVYLATFFLDAVMQEFIDKASKLKGLDKAVNFATKHRALGLGVLGYHTLLQKKQLPFGSTDARRLNNEIFKYIKNESENASYALGSLHGACEVKSETGRRNSHLIAIAPTFSNSIISGFSSAGIEPIAANAYVHRTAVGSYVRRNPELEKLNLLSEEDWKSVVAEDGSVQHLTCLTDEQKAVFLTAREINQMDLVDQAATRQQYIDQGQSLNLFFPANTPKKFIHEVHLEAWELGVKSLYYLRSTSVLKGDLATKTFAPEGSCESCEG